MADCLNTLVGLTDNTEDCYDSGRPVDYNTSTSGYFIDDYEFGFPVKGAVYSNARKGNSIWDELTNARTKAIGDVKADIQAALSQVRKKKIVSWTGQIGTIETENPNTYNPTNENVVGVQINPVPTKYVSLIIKAIWLYTDTTASVNVNITSNDTNFTSSVESISGVAGQAVRYELSSEKELPLHSYYANELKYNISYTRGDIKPLYNKVYDEHCNYFPWRKHLNVDGFATSTLDNNHDATSHDAYGLAIEGYFKTHDLNWICDLSEKGGDEYLTMIARMIQLKAGIRLMQLVLESDKVNFYTVLTPERIYGRLQRYSNLYNDILMRLANEIPSQITEIYGGKKGEPTIGYILI